MSLITKVLTPVFLVMYSVSALGGQTPKTPDEIYNWTQKILKENTVPKKEIQKPEIKFVDKITLQKVFKNNSQKIFQYWEKSYGETKAKEMMGAQLRDIIGLFDPKTKIIYVGNFLEECHKEAIVAHEITHYFQERGFNQKVWYMSRDDEHFIKELQAYGIQERYEKEFCRK